LMFRLLDQQSENIPGSERKQIHLNDKLLKAVHHFRSILTAIEEELVFEGELYTLDDYQLRIVEEQIETMQLALSLFENSEALICWVSDSPEGLTLSIMPKTVKEVLQERVFSKNMPIVFSSATISVEGSFQYVADSVGLENFLSFSVNSPYDYPNQMQAFAPKIEHGRTFLEKMEIAGELLERTNGRALILFRTHEELQQFKSQITIDPSYADMSFYYEGDKEISFLISAFQSNEASVLCAVSLWEGLDVPGPSLSNVMIWSLPFPPNDPVFMAKRNASESPFEEVDLPHMLLRLRQGMGRLIRSSGDRGIIAILSDELQHKVSVRESVLSVMPEGVVLQESL
jgi:ATP-dependent DNA helicase DinG